MNATKVILGLDPAYGLRKYPGVACVADGKLVAAAAVKVPQRAIQKVELGARVDVIADLVVEWFRHFVVPRSARPLEYELTLVYEWPQVYGVGKAPGDPNDLPPLAALGAAVARDLRPDRIVTPKPREWQGGTSKNVDGDPWDCSRGHKLKARLRADELAVIPSSHDAIDAVGLALHATDRALAIARRVYPGATITR